jgi:FMN phosphatase YigB (HAD superfamily)
MKSAGLCLTSWLNDELSMNDCLGAVTPRAPVPGLSVLDGIGAIIFDLDGTLYDGGKLVSRLLFNRAIGWFSIIDIWYTWAERRSRKALAGRDFQNVESYYREFFAAMRRRTFRKTAFLRQWYFERYMPRMNALLKTFYPARQGMGELFKNIDSLGLPRAVYSDYPLVEERLEAIGLDPNSCGKLYGPENFGAQKPAPRPFLVIAQDLGCVPAKVLVVGDRDKTDGKGAAAAGMRFIKIADKKEKKRGPSLLWKEFCSLVELRQPH